MIPCSACHKTKGQPDQASLLPYRGYRFHEFCLRSVLTRNLGEARAEIEISEIKKGLNAIQPIKTTVRALQVAPLSQARQ